MDSLRQFPLGARFPESPHAVVGCLPTMADVRGYEENDPRVMDALESGYPRFVCHQYVKQLIDFYIEREALTGRFAMLVSGRRAADDLIHWLGNGYAKLEVDPAVFLVFCDADQAENVQTLKQYIQHVGCGISSRQAEDLLLSHRLLEERFEEDTASGHVLSRVEQDLAERIGCRTSDVLVCSSGMNAFYAGFRSVQEFQSSRGRTVWLQLGWLYLDSGKILEQFLGEEEHLECLYDVHDIESVVERIRSAGKKLGAVVVECPSNPLIRVCDLERIAEVVREQGGVMIVDPTIASVYNVNVLPYADLLVTSLTKYAAIEGDIMIGALALNPASPFYGDLVMRTSSFYVPPYARDLARLAVEMEAAPAVIKQVNENAARLCAFLKAHPAVKRIYCAGCSEHIENVAHGDLPVGAVISVELEGSMEKFYDAVELMKGPSFGARFTLLCPFMYLAHYDLVTNDSGRAFLNSVGIDPELIRISVGEEPYASIESVFARALEASVVG